MEQENFDERSKFDYVGVVRSNNGGIHNSYHTYFLRNESIDRGRWLKNGVLWGPEMPQELGAP